MALLPPKFLDAVVSIEILDGTENKFRAVATGFLIGLPAGPKIDKGDELFRICLVSNRHVFEKKAKIFLRFNKEKEARRYDLNLIDTQGKQIWKGHPRADIGMISINAQKLNADGIEFGWFPEERLVTFKKGQDLGISQGDDVFVLGFPMGITGDQRMYVINRSGSIARIDEEIVKDQCCYLIDSFVFPGNSGGPVILKPQAISVTGTKAVETAYVIGLIKGYIPYEEIAYSLKSDPPEPRIKFIDNSGLANVVPMDFVLELGHEMVREQQKTEKAQDAKPVAEPARKESLPD